MSGTRAGGLKARETIMRKMGAGYYAEIGRKGGLVQCNGGFGSDKVGTDGLTGRQRARIAGAKGGAISKRGPAKNN